MLRDEGFENRRYFLLLMEETYPSTRVVKNVLDNDGDLSIVQSKKNQAAGFFNYAKSFTYTSAGAVSSIQLGNGKWESTVFNNRLQPTQIALGTVQNGTDKLKLNFTYNTPNTANNNGNVLSQTITVPTVGQTPGFVATQTYIYDSLNRLKSAEETIPGQTGWKQTFLYDRYGNRNFDTTNNNTTTIPAGCPVAVCNPAAIQSNNRLTGYGYDNAGNTTTDAESRTFTYDGENKQTKVVSSGQTVGEYFYDGDGKRVKKVVPATGETTIFVYDASGKMVAEYSTQVASQENAKVSYLTSDHLGSPRITTDANGGVISRRDFHPFGEEVFTTQRTQGLGYTADNIRQKFTAYERDQETNLDFAQARMYANKLGRFMECDPIYFSKEHQLNPQKWNAYIYVINNPLLYTDPTGLKPKRVIDIFITFDTDKEVRKQWNQIQKDAKRQGIKVNIYRSDNGKSSAEKFIEAIQKAGHSVIVVGHSHGTQESVQKGVTTGHFYGMGVEFGGKSVLSNKIYTMADNGEGTNTADGINAKAKTIAVFTCNFGSTFEGLGSKNKTSFISLDNGRDGESSIGSVNAAGQAVARQIIAGGNPQQMQTAAQQVFDKSISTWDVGEKVLQRTLQPAPVIPEPDDQ